MSKNLPSIQSPKFDQKEIQLLRDTYAKGLDDTELKIFLKQSETMGLNPFKKEIYAVKYNGRLTLMTSIEGRRKMAHETGKYLGCKIFVDKDEKGLLFSATAIVKKLVNGHVAEFEATVMFDEFNSKQGKWKDMPEQMIRKVAESTALRMAFPSLDHLVDEAESTAVAVGAFDHDEVQVHPEYEAIAASETNLDDYIVPVGKRKGTKLKDVPEQELREMISWAATQEVLDTAWTDYAFNANTYLTGETNV